MKSHNTHILFENVFYVVSIKISSQINFSFFFFFEELNSNIKSTTIYFLLRGTNVSLKMNINKYETFK